MIETTGLLDKIRQHDKVPVALNENCAICLPDDVMRVLFKPQKLSYYYFQYLDKGTATFQADLKEFAICDGQLAFGLPNQVFTKFPFDKTNRFHALSFDQTALAMLPGSYPFLVNPLNVNSITFEPVARERVRATFSTLYQLLNASNKQRKAEIILAYLHTLLTEFNSAYMEQHGENPEFISDPKLSKYIAFKVAVETDLTEQHDVQNIADSLAMTSNTLYRIVKEYAGVSPKEWINNRLMLEAQRKLQYSTLSVKELAYSLGFNDPGYFSRLFKKTTGKSVTQFMTELHDLSRQ